MCIILLEKWRNISEIRVVIFFLFLYNFLSLLMTFVHFLLLSVWKEKQTFKIIFRGFQIFICLFQDLLRIWYMSVTCLLIVYYFNLVVLAFILLVPCILLLTAHKGGMLCCWFMSVIFLLCLSFFHTSQVWKFPITNASLI